MNGNPPILNKPTPYPNSIKVCTCKARGCIDGVLYGTTITWAPDGSDYVKDVEQLGPCECWCHGKEV